MKTAHRLSILTLLILLLCGCTNNGDIGPLYGQWQLIEFTIDGEAAQVDCENYTIKFQNDIVVIKELIGHNDYLNSYGTWQKEDGTLTLNFTHTQGESIVGLNPPTALMIPARAVTPMTIEKLTSSALEFSFINDKGERLLYRFKKLA